MKQTAVEWLVEQLECDDSKIARVIGLKKYNKVVSQAKEIEKQQIETAYNKAVPFKFGKEYYEETFTNHLNINPK